MGSVWFACALKEWWHQNVHYGNTVSITTWGDVSSCFPSDARTLAADIDFTIVWFLWFCCVFINLLLFNFTLMFNFIDAVYYIN